MGHVITFAQQKGGAGKTTLLIHLAHAWALAGQKVAVIDLDPQASLTQWLKLAKLDDVVSVESRDYRVGSDIRTAVQKYDFVLVDCPGNASSLLEAAIRASDLVLVPCQPTTMDVWATGAILKMAANEKTASSVVLNRVAARSNATDKAIEALQKDGANLCKTHVGNRVGFSAGFSQGKTAMTPGRNSVAKVEVEALRQELEATLRQ